MKKTILALLLAITAGAAFAGQCDHSWNSDKNGNSCGDRAADRKSGGK